MISFLVFLFSLKVALCSCRPENRRSGFHSGRSQYSVNRIGQMPLIVSENSGLVYNPPPDSSTLGTFWTHNDSGGRPTLYRIQYNGMLIDSLPLSSAGLTNVDWEALAHQDSTILFIGDIGNNANTRRELIIYRIDLRQPNQPEQIRVHYADQHAFPPTKDTRNFDSEALFFHRDSLFLISKNRSRPSRPVKLYALPAKQGTYVLYPTDSTFIKSMVTDASISPNGQTLALLTYGKVFLFELASGRVSFKRPQLCLRIPRGQTESLSFVNNTDFVISNEQGILYLVRKK